MHHRREIKSWNADNNGKRGGSCAGSEVEVIYGLKNENVHSGRYCSNPLEDVLQKVSGTKYTIASKYVRLVQYIICESV